MSEMFPVDDHDLPTYTLLERRATRTGLITSVSIDGAIEDFYIPWSVAHSIDVANDLINLEKGFSES